MNPSVDALLAVLGVPDDLAEYEQIMDDTEEAMMAAADQVIAEHAERNPELRLALRNDRRLWDVVKIPADQLQPGMRATTGEEIRTNRHDRGGWVSLVRDPTHGERPRSSTERITRSMTFEQWDDSPAGRVVVPLPWDGSALVRMEQPA